MRCFRRGDSSVLSGVEGRIAQSGLFFGVRINLQIANSKAKLFLNCPLQQMAQKRLDNKGPLLYHLLSLIVKKSAE